MEVLVLIDIQEQMERQLRRHGISAEITFFRVDGFSVLVDDSASFERAKAIFAALPSVRFESEDRDDELGHVAYYQF